MRRYAAAGLAVAAVASFAPAAAADPLYCVEVERRQVLFWEVRDFVFCVL